MNAHAANCVVHRDPHSCDCALTVRYPGLTDDLATARASQTSAPFTIPECERILAMLRDQQIVERVTLVRAIEFLLADSAATAKRHQQEIREMEREARDSARDAVSFERHRASSQHGGEDM